MTLAGKFLVASFWFRVDEREKCRRSPITGWANNKKLKTSNPKMFLLVRGGGFVSYIAQLAALPCLTSLRPQKPWSLGNISVFCGLIKLLTCPGLNLWYAADHACCNHLRLHHAPQRMHGDALGEARHGCGLRERRLGRMQAPSLSKRFTLVFRPVSAGLYRA